MFGRAAIRLGIGPHSSIIMLHFDFPMTDSERLAITAEMKLTSLKAISWRSLLDRSYYDLLLVFPR